MKFCTIILLTFLTSNAECYLSSKIYLASITQQDKKTTTAYVAWLECWGAPNLESSYGKDFFLNNKQWKTKAISCFEANSLVVIDYKDQSLTASSSQLKTLFVDSLVKLQFLGNGMHDGRDARIATVSIADSRLMGSKPREISTCDCNDPCKVYLLNYSDMTYGDRLSDMCRVRSFISDSTFRSNKIVRLLYMTD